MTYLLIALSIVILLTSGMKMSFMPMKISSAWALLWGVAACLITLLFSGMSQKEVYGLLNAEKISALEFLELLIMAGYLFSKGILRKITGYYPGLMVWVPVCMISYYIAGMFPDMDFAVAAMIAGCTVSLFLIGLILLFRYMSVDMNSYYKAVLVALLSNIIIYGLL